AIAPGCDSGPKIRPNRAVIQGKVTYQGKPVPGGFVLFYSAENPIYNTEGTLNPDGTYAADAPIGKLNVAVDTAVAQVGMPDRFVKLPAHYADPAKSGLTCEVVAGENADVNFDLK